MIRAKRHAVNDAHSVMVERALRGLIDSYRDHLDPSDLSIGDLPWLGGIYGQVRQGFPLRDDQIARVSAIRARLARACHGC